MYKTIISYIGVGFSQNTNDKGHVIKFFCGCAQRPHLRCYPREGTMGWLGKFCRNYCGKKDKSSI